MRRGRLCNIIHNSFLYLPACILSPFLLSILRLVPTGSVAMCQLDVSMKGLRVLHWCTVLHNLGKKWAQEHLINLRAELWCWWSRHPVSSISHWNTSCPTIVCSNQDGGVTLQDYFPVPTWLSEHWYEQSSHSRGPLEAVSSLLAQETWQQCSLISAAALSGTGRLNVNPFTNGSDENSKLKKSSVDHCAALA